MFKLRVREEEFHTILAALRFYQEHGQGNPTNRSERIRDLATNGNMTMALDDDAIDKPCQRLNTD